MYHSALPNVFHGRTIFHKFDDTYIDGILPEEYQYILYEYVSHGLTLIDHQIGYHQGVLVA
jgi:hypothetical protein